MANLDLSDKDLLQLKNCQVGKDLQMAKDFNGAQLEDFNSSVSGFLRFFKVFTSRFFNGERNNSSLQPVTGSCLMAEELGCCVFKGFRF